MSARGVASLVVVLAHVLLLPWSAAAQTALSGAIAGEVKDTTGAAAAWRHRRSRQSRADREGPHGRHRRARPLPDRGVAARPLHGDVHACSGFNTLRREGIELSAGFTANVNVEMQVGALEETITVSGASPVVDTQNVRSQNVFSRELLDVLPTGKSVVALGALTLGTTPQGSGNSSGHDVGGNKGENTKALNIHGIIGNQKTRWDGTPINDLIGAGGRQYYINTAAVQEIVLDTGGISAESETGGANMNVIPREGGNRFSVYFLVNYGGENLQNRQLLGRPAGTWCHSRCLRSTGSPMSAEAWAGPIQKDKLWFYTAHRWWGFKSGFAGNYFNTTQDTLFYTPDLSRPAFGNEHQRDHNVRVTWQAAEKHKVNLTYSYEQNCRCYYQNGLNRAPEAAVAYQQHPTMYLGSWTYPATNRLLFEAAGMFLHYRMEQNYPKETSPDTYQVTELSTGYTYGSQLMNLLPGYTDYGKCGPQPGHRTVRRLLHHRVARLQGRDGGDVRVRQRGRQSGPQRVLLVPQSSAGLADAGGGALFHGVPDQAAGGRCTRRISG